MNTLYYGDNMEVLRKYIKDESIDLIYIDPPFNSKRNYNQIYNNIGSEDRAQAQAFVDTWVWDSQADAGFQQIIANEGSRFTAQTIDLITGLQKVLKKGSLLAYLVSMTLRIVEIFRVLKPTGSFYLHCDPTSSHYLKLVLDSVFEPQGGDFLNEIIWSYKTGGVSKRWFGRKHDVIFFYAKSPEYHFEPQQDKSYIATLPEPHTPSGKRLGMQRDEGGKYRYVTARDVWEIDALFRNNQERMGYPTQKPEALLDRIIKSSCPDNGVVLDAYCGCGTTIAVAQRLNRKWIGMDITYQSIALILRRLEGEAGPDAWPQVDASIIRDGIPRDMESAEALANKKDDRVRKEFEKWAVLTYTNNRAIINDKKGADAGIDGTAYFQTGSTENAKIVFQVKSGNVGRGDIAKLSGDMAREGAAMATFITLKDSTAPMRAEAKSAGVYQHPLMQRSYDKIQIVTVQEIVEQEKRLDIPMSLEVLKAAQVKAKGEQLDLIAE
jgi:site-specific DNA-methyltransferase (adenine-specific)